MMLSYRPSQWLSMKHIYIGNLAITEKLAWAWYYPHMHCLLERWIIAAEGMHC